MKVFKFLGIQPIHGKFKYINAMVKTKIKITTRDSRTTGSMDVRVGLSQNFGPGSSWS